MTSDDPKDLSNPAGEPQSGSAERVSCSHPHAVHGFHVGSDETVYSACPDCRAIWETEPDWTAGDPCNNCAWRAGSKEKSDPYAWMAILAACADGVPFYCHKGVPMLVGDPPAPGANHPVAFDFHLGESGRPLPGTAPICRGWLRARAIHKAAGDAGLNRLIREDQEP